MIFGFGGAGKDAARAQEKFNAQAIEELRRQFNITQENFQPFIDAGTGALPQVIEGTTAEGLDARLARIFDTDTFGALRDERERSVQGQLAAGGLTRSGQGIETLADVPQDIGLALEGLLTGRSTNLAGSGQSAVAGLGGLGAQNAQSIAGILQDTGRARSSGIVTDAGAQAAGTQGLLNAGLSAAAFFSDPRLKKNIEQVGRVCDLRIYEWEWDTASDLVKKCVPYGFMADEVELKYPQHVFEFAGLKVIDYEYLMLELEEKTVSNN